MPWVTAPNGDVFEETGPVALAYYEREPGYEVSDEQPVQPDAPKPGSKAALQAEARELGLDDSGTVAQLEERIANYVPPGAVVEEVEPLDPAADEAPDVEHAEPVE